MKVLNNKRVLEDDNNIQYFLDDTSKVRRVIDLKDIIVIEYGHEIESDDDRPIYCFCKKDGKILWQVENPCLIEDENFEENSYVSLYGFYKTDEENGEKLPLYTDSYAERMAMFWYTKNKYIDIYQRMDIYNNQGDLKESKKNIILEDLTQEEKDTLLCGKNVSGPIWYSKPEEDYEEDKYKIICRVSSGGNFHFCFIDLFTGKLKKIEETY